MSLRLKSHSSKYIRENLNITEFEKWVRLRDAEQDRRYLIANFKDKIERRDKEIERLNKIAKK
jgi:hypothetical protein